MFWQYAIVSALVVGSSGYLLRAAWKTWHPPKGSCGGGCGCGPKEKKTDGTFVPLESLKIRKR